MGVYVFQRKIHPEWYKVGHYIGSNPWKRIFVRGFFSCLCPNFFKKELTAEHVQLVAWFPQCNQADEQQIHRLLHKYTSYIGECFYDYKECNIVSIIEKTFEIESNHHQHTLDAAYSKLGMSLEEGLVAWAKRPGCKRRWLLMKGLL